MPKSAAAQAERSNVEPPKRLKMKDLEDATGVGREAIRFYIREGLLPEPERPARNVAWYDPSFVEKIRFIKDLQEKRYLPLEVIRRIVAETGEPSRAEVEALLELDGKLFPQVAGGPKPEGEALSSLARRCGVPAADVRGMGETGAIQITTRRRKEWVEASSVAIVELWGELRKAGFTPEAGFPVEHVGLYVDMVEWLAREELRVFSRGVTGRVEGQAAVDMAEHGIDVVNQVIAVLRKNTLLRLIAEGDIGGPAKRGAKRRRPKARP